MSKKLVTVVKVDGSIATHQLDKAPSLRQLQAWVGGYIERVPLWTMYLGKRCDVYADEEGKLKGYPPNVRATQLWQLAVKDKRPVDILCGDIVIVTSQPKK